MRGAEARTASSYAVESRAFVPARKLSSARRCRSAGSVDQRAALIQVADDVEQPALELARRRAGEQHAADREVQRRAVRRRQASHTRPAERGRAGTRSACRRAATAALQGRRSRGPTAARSSPSSIAARKCDGGRPRPTARRLLRARDVEAVADRRPRLEAPRACRRAASRVSREKVCDVLRDLGALDGRRVVAKHASLRGRTTISFEVCSAWRN